MEIENKDRGKPRAMDAIPGMATCQEETITANGEYGFFDGSREHLGVWTLVQLRRWT
jgi:hypothetical protein